MECIQKKLKLMWDDKKRGKYLVVLCVCFYEMHVGKGTYGVNKETKL